ncbi:MAG: T9SS type A sorting domain-containing protein [Sporocytophaga sp.]|uniref:3-coathanger stack domain-containing protein n=1 Tax=Sporocytophaga sp. TaxID=2231183 RepID=UPI001B1793E0|nr:3-coathanger stack domain-containing protein [Sporocytophaga sp.]MBO9698802.1 T9SS type A sorting domain-containing protein [Sporocytophaga sp.]
MKNRYIFNKPYYLLVTVLMLKSIVSFAQVQNPYWYFPPYRIDFTTATPTVSSIGTGALTKASIANGIHNTSGNLSFYVAGSDAQGRTGQTGDLYIDQLGKEELIIPVPGECNSYYVLGYTTVNGIKNGIAVTSYYLVYSKVSVNSNGTWTSTSGGYIPIDDPSDATYASSIPFEDGSSFASYLYILDGSEHTITRYKVTSSGIDMGVQLSNTSGFFKGYELELSHDQRYLAFGTQASDVPYIYVYNLDNNTYETYFPFSNWGRIAGVEFSKDGKSIFAAEYITNKIYKIDLNSHASTEVQGSFGLGTSQLELAYDGYIYASNGTQLKGFDPSAASPSIVKTINVSNPISYDADGNVYTLVDQIDGLKYSAPFSIPSCLGLKTYSGVNSGSGGGLPSMTQNYEIIKTSGSVIVNTSTSVTFKAGVSIDMEPGFEAQNGSIFDASIQSCAAAQIPNCSSTYRMAEESFDVALTSSLVLSPNPTSGNFSVQCNFELSENVIGTISNSQGEAVMTITPGMFNGNMLEVSMGGFPKGLYYLNIKNGNEQYGKKVVIQ